MQKDKISNRINWYMVFWLLFYVAVFIAAWLAFRYLLLAILVWMDAFMINN